MNDRIKDSQPTMKNQPSSKAMIPVYTSKGDWASLLVYPYLYDVNGEWIGWITPDREVYDVNGIYVGWLAEGPRILRRRSANGPKPRLQPPPPPVRIRPPATVPLPPLMAELPYQVLDVLDSDPASLHTVDRGELREDMV